MSGSPLYGRQIEVIGGIQGQPGLRLLAQGRTTDFRMDFDAAYKSDGTPSKAKVTVYNPPSALVLDLQDPNNTCFIAVRAGYEGLGPVFAGTPVRDSVLLARQAGDLVFSVEAMSGGKRYRDAVSAVSGVPGERAITVARDLILNAGWQVGALEIDDTYIYNRGFTFGGSTRVGLDRIGRFTKTEVIFTAPEEVSMLKINKEENTTVVAKFSALDGNLLSIPVHTDRGVKFQGLLTAGIFPGMSVSLEYLDLLSGILIQGSCRVLDVTYTGSNYGSTFAVSIEGTRLRESNA